jgi:hypothetical protein
MTRKSLRTCVLLLGLLLGTSSSAYADALAISSVSLTDFQITPAAGTVTFNSPATLTFTRATNSLGAASEGSSEDPTLSQSSANVEFATSSAMANAITNSATATSIVNVSGCNCSGFSLSLAFLGESFIITGGQGDVDVTFSGLLFTHQLVMTDPLGVRAESNLFFLISLSGTEVFSVGPSGLSIGPNDMMELDAHVELSRVITLQFNTEYRYTGILSVNASAETEAPEIPEPATVVLLISGLGSMAGFMRKRRITGNR